ncbi:MAG: RloB domain-containing protein [Nitratireductor sp.]|nr:RloB domain-containing protein [Nitratireductor sp.]
MRPPYPRVLIVCEGAKTEVSYFEEIRQKSRIPSVNVRVIHSPLGQEPKQIIEGAEQEFGKTKAFEKVYAVFDRDAHLTYANAIVMAEARDNRFKNDEKRLVGFKAIVSVPSFEFWLLLHFADIKAALHRNAALQELKKYLPEYRKGMKGIFQCTEANLEIAIERAKALKATSFRLPGNDAYTDVHELVISLRNLKK